MYSYLVPDLKIAYHNNNYSSIIIMRRKKKDKIFCVTYLEIKSLKNFVGSLTLTIVPRKTKIYRWIHKFKATGSVNNISMKAENPRSGRKLTARCPDDVNEVRDSVKRIPKKSL